MTLKFDGWPWKTIGHLSYIASSFVHHFIAISEFKLKLQSGNAQFGSKSANFCPVWPWNLTDDLENQIGHLFSLDSSFVHHFIAISEFKLQLQSGNAQFGSQSAIFCSVWPWNLTDDLGNTIGHLFYATSSFVHHFVAIGEFKLELQSGNAQFGSKSAIFFPCDLEILQMTLKNNRAPLLSNMKLCASFHDHMWI